MNDVVRVQVKTEDGWETIARSDEPAGIEIRITRPDVEKQ